MKDETVSREELFAEEESDEPDGPTHDHDHEGED